MQRRSFLNLMLGAAAAPAIVRAESLMRIKPIILLDEYPADFIDALKYNIAANKTIVTEGIFSKTLWPGLQAYCDKHYQEFAIEYKDLFKQ